MAPKRKAAAEEPPKRGAKAAAKEPPPKRGAKASAPEPPPPKRGAKASTPAPEPAPPKRGAKKAAVEEEIDYDSWPVPKLIARLKELGVSATGSKAALVMRLKTVAEAGAEPAKAAPAKSNSASPKASAPAKKDEEPPARGTKRTAAESQASPPAKKDEEPPARGTKRTAAESQASSSSKALPLITDSGPVEYEDGEFKAEYAKSGRSECKKCKEKIPEGSMRLGKMVRSEKFDGKIPMWYCASCFLGQSTLPRSCTLIAGFSGLRPEDQDLIQQKIPATAEGSGDGVDNEAVKEQSKKLFEIQDILSQLSDNQIKEMMELNGYPTLKLGVSATKVDLCCDGILFGATSMCEVCNDEKKGHILLNGESYKCTGWVNEYLKCTFRTQTPERTVWQLTEAAKSVAGGKLKKMKLKTGERLFTRGLSEVDDEDSVVMAKPEKPKPLLQDLMVAVAGRGENLTSKKVADLVKQHGGTFVQSIAKAVDFVISTQETADKETPEVEAAKEHQIPGVTDSFLTDSVENNALQEMGPYLLWGEARRFRKAIEEVVTSKFIEKDGVSMDSDVGELASKAHVLVDMSKKLVYSEMLNRTDMTSGGNSFYTIHLLESDDADNPEYWVFRKWGRIGVNQGGTKVEPFSSNKYKAIQNFEKLYLEKTDNNFGHKKDEFEVKPGKFIRLDMQHKALGPPNKKAKKGDNNAEDGGADQPLGKLSKAQIEKGDKVLDKLESAIGEGTTGPAASAKLMAFSAEFYSLIPHNFGLGKPPTINTDDMVGRERALLQFYMRMGFEEMGGETDEKLTPISGVMTLPLPKTLNEAAKIVCGAKDIKSCDTKATPLAKKQAGKPTEKMGAEMYASILLYTANAIYKDLNKCLRDEDRAKVSRYFSYLRLLFEACGRLPQTNKTLWRGLGVDLAPTYKVGSKIIWWGVSSCTSEKKVAEDFMNGCGDKATLVTVETKTATDISELSFYQNEAESILLPGTQLEVLSSVTKGNKSYITLREVGRVVN